MLRYCNDMTHASFPLCSKLEQINVFFLRVLVNYGFRYYFILNKRNL